MNGLWTPQSSQDVTNRSVTSWQQTVVMEFWTWHMRDNRLAWWVSALNKSQWSTVCGLLALCDLERRSASVCPSVCLSVCDTVYNISTLSAQRLLSVESGKFTKCSCNLLQRLGTKHTHIHFVVNLATNCCNGIWETRRHNKHNGL